jgi:hypothetical protein
MFTTENEYNLQHDEGMQPWRIRTHDETGRQNGSICPMSKYGSITL